MDQSSSSPPNSPPVSQQKMPRACILLSALQCHAQARGLQEAFFPKNKKRLYCHPSQLPHNTHLKQVNSFFTVLAGWLWPSQRHIQAGLSCCTEGRAVQGCDSQICAITLVRAVPSPPWEPAWAVLPWGSQPRHPCLGHTFP